ncbi:unnamed protein product [Clavelina lepadiformis]|uniref:Uncharacterized protein n=1 Tax=Clavelina lepadiformis TaxID=159417 RepID=A0ABP0FKB1_CLALP
MGYKARRTENPDVQKRKSGKSKTTFVYPLWTLSLLDRIRRTGKNMQLLLGTRTSRARLPIQNPKPSKNLTHFGRPAKPHNDGRNHLHTKQPRCHRRTRPNSSRICTAEIQQSTALHTSKQATNER